MVSQSSQRTLAQPTQPADPARSFNERSHGLMRKIHTLTTALSDFGVEIALLINTPYVEYTYESTDGMLRDFNTELPEENRFRPEDVKNLFRGRVLACPSIKSMSPLRGYSGRSSPTPSTSSTASASSISLPAATGLTFPIPLPTRPVGPATTLPSTSPISVRQRAVTGMELTLPALPSPPQGLGISFSGTGSSPTLTSDFPFPTSPTMDIANLLNSDPWPSASDVPFPQSPAQDKTTQRSLPSARPIRPTTPTPSASGRSRLQSPYRVLKISTPPKSQRRWFN